MDGVEAVAPQIEGFGQLTGSDGEKLGGVHRVVAEVAQARRLGSPTWLRRLDGLRLRREDLAAEHLGDNLLEDVFGYGSAVHRL